MLKSEIIFAVFITLGPSIEKNWLYTLSEICNMIKQKEGITFVNGCSEIFRQAVGDSGKMIGWDGQRVIR